MRNNLIIIAVTLVLLSAGLYLYSTSKSKPTKPVITLRSKKPDVISKVVFAKSIDTKGRPVILGSKFGKKEEEIYMLVNLKNVKEGTKIEYVRYRNGKYLDHRSLEVTKANAGFASFNWKLQTPPGVRPAGNYLIKVYTNGKLETATTYIVS